MSATSADVMPTPQESVPSLQEAADEVEANAAWIVQAMRGDLGPWNVIPDHLDVSPEVRAANEADERKRDAIRATMTPQDWVTIYHAIIDDTRQGWFNPDDPRVFDGVNARVISGGLRQTVGYAALMINRLSESQIDLLTQGIGATRVLRDERGRVIGLAAGLGVAGESRRVWKAPNPLIAHWPAWLRRVISALEL